MTRAIAVAIWAVLFAPPALAADQCAPDRVIVLVPGDAVSINVELAETPEDQARGLMFRPSLPRDAGMLFVFEPDRKARFWMRNTMIPLDLIFVDRTGRVEGIAADAVPFSEQTLESDGAVRAVFEINGGLSAELGITAGIQLVHPAFDEAPEDYRCLGG